MKDRPKRGRIPTKPFAYRDTPFDSPDSESGSVHADAQATPALPSEADRRGLTKISNRMRTWNSVSTTTESMSYVRARTITSRRQNLRRRKYFTDAKEAFCEQNKHALPTIRNDPVADIDSDVANHEKQDCLSSSDAGADNPAKPESRTRWKQRPPPSKGRILLTARRESDDVIEQWYADPYERINPNGVSYDQWRFGNLQRGMLNQGFNKNRARDTATWLMRCNGYRKVPSATDSRRGRKKARLSAQNSPAKISNGRAASAPNVHAEVESFNAATPYNSFATAASSPTTARVSMEYGSPPESRVGEIVPDIDRNRRSTFSDASMDSDQDEPIEMTREDQKLATDSKKIKSLPDHNNLLELKRSLRAFEMVYGPEIPKTDSMSSEHNHFSRVSEVPVLRPKRGLSTQGHYPLQEAELPKNDAAFFNGVSNQYDSDCQAPGTSIGEKPDVRTVLTEDVDFGLTLFPPSQTATEAELNLYNSQMDRLGGGSQTVADSLVGKEREAMSQIMREHSDPKERRKKIRELNNENAKLVMEELKQKVFEWETSSTIRGGLPKLSTDDKLLDGAFSLGQRLVWKEIRQRQEILTEGGEEATRLLEREWEEEQLEFRRERRRKEAARARAKKRAGHDPSAGRRGISD